MATSPIDILQQYWKYSSFRPNQESIIQAALQGKDVLAILPTGAGKSICFQIPALAKPGIAIVVTPLVALMKDQVEHLRQKNITAIYLSGKVSQQQLQQQLHYLVENNGKFIYISPERIQNKLFLQAIQNLPIQLVVIDEAHCISQWGQDFRPAYLHIASLKTHFPAVPFLAFTASATQQVKQDIVQYLQLQNPFVVKQSVARKNIAYVVKHTASKLAKTVEIAQKLKGSGIIYCSSRLETLKLSNELRQHNINCDFYHAGLTTSERDKKQTAWQHNKVHIMVCTNAFGMGIDKPDVRWVIHYKAPDCIENYYQEAGRGGRDEKKAFAVLLFNESDWLDLQKQLELKFPSAETIKNIYQQLANFLQIPAGTGAEQYFTFDFQMFCDVFKLDSLLVMHTLKILEEEGLLQWIDYNYQPTTVQVIASVNDLRSLEQDYPDLDPYLKILLRSYAHILDTAVIIHEHKMASLLRCTVEAFKQKLLALQQLGYVAYKPQTNQTQLYFPVNRAVSAHVNVNYSRILVKKKHSQAKLLAIKNYIYNNQTCRTQLLCQYFNDDNQKPCGICDVCVSKAKPSISKEVFIQISEGCMAFIEKHNPAMVMDLYAYMPQYSKKYIDEVLFHLQETQQISVSAIGEIKKQ